MGFLLQGGQKNMLHAEVIVLEFGGLLGRPTEEGLEARGNHGAARGDARTGDFGKSGNFRFKPLGKSGGLGAKLFDEPRTEAVRLGGERVKEVFDFDRLVSLLGGGGLSRGDSFLGVFGELVEIHGEIIG